jgi:hypothetical protein
MPDQPFPVVPDTGTAEAARLAAARTGQPGRWVRLDWQHIRHVQQPVEDRQLLKCPTCPPSAAGVLPAVASSLVAEAIGHTHAPVQLTVDTHDVRPIPNHPPID